jgi:TPR repeat protein
MKISADLGYACAANQTGDMYAFGRGTPRDAKAAVPYYFVAATKGFAPGLRGLREAAENGSLEARIGLVLVYRDGMGAKVDRVEAHRWLRAAALLDAKRNEDLAELEKEMTAEELRKARRREN